ncbi:MAG: hypothetical protein AVDCRST_MAG90-299, partial [uncultured Microvirga sp.]
GGRWSSGTENRAPRGWFQKILPEPKKKFAAAFHGPNHLRADLSRRGALLV